MPTETLYISGVGDECAIGQEVNCGSCPNHYTCVDEESQDGDFTRVWADGNQRDLYAVDNHSVGSGTINSVTVYAVCKRPGANGTLYARMSIKSGGVAQDGDAKVMTLSWATYSHAWANKPGGGAWGSDWSVIDALQAGVRLEAAAKAPIECTMVWVVVDYEPYVPPGLENKSANMAAKMIAGKLI